MRNLFVILTCLALCACCAASLAPKQELTIAQKRSHFFRIDGWPYQRSSIFTKFPAELVSGSVITPFVYFATPFFVDYKADKPEIGKALYESERTLMENPGYVLYRGAGYPFQAMETAALYSYATVRGKPTPKAGDLIPDWEWADSSVAVDSGKKEARVPAAVNSDSSVKESAVILVKAVPDSSVKEARVPAATSADSSRQGK